MDHRINIARIKAVANALKDIKDKVVFVGGATISLYPDRPVFEARPTDDIDVIVEVLNYTERAKLEERLRALGFVHDMESGIVCRYKINGIVVDVMPTNDPTIGFQNIWYPAGFVHAIVHEIDERCSIKILSAPYFIASKLEAFKGRGQNDGRTSHDFEDIVYILENRETIWEEMNNADEPLRQYLHSAFQMLLRNPYISEWIDCHVEKTSTPFTNSIIEKTKAFVEAY